MCRAVNFHVNWVCDIVCPPMVIFFRAPLLDLGGHTKIPYGVYRVYAAVLIRAANCSRSVSSSAAAQQSSFLSHFFT